MQNPPPQKKKKRLLLSATSLLPTRRPLRSPSVRRFRAEDSEVRSSVGPHRGSPRCCGGPTLHRIRSGSTRLSETGRPVQTTYDRSYGSIASHGSELVPELIHHITYQHFCVVSISKCFDEKKLVSGRPCSWSCLVLLLVWSAM